MKRSPKDILAFLLSMALCAYAVWNELQFVAVVGFIGALCVIYKGTVVRSSQLVLDLSSRLTRAKYGAFELQIDKQIVGESLAAGAPAGLRGVIGAMTPNHVGLLLAIAKAERFPIAGGVVNQLRELRNLGLIEHDKPELGASSTVWLTMSGSDVIAFLLENQQAARMSREKSNAI